MSPGKYELGSYIPEGGILYSHRHENLKSYISVSADAALCVPKSVRAALAYDNKMLLIPHYFCLARIGFS
jgi:hypothetical protein